MRAVILGRRDIETQVSSLRIWENRDEKRTRRVVGELYVNFSWPASLARPVCRPRMDWRNLVRSLVIVLALAAAWPAAARSAACTQSEACLDRLVLSTGGTIPLYRSHPLARSEAVRRVVLVVHGNQRDADRYYDRVVAAASADFGLDDLVLLAPNFQTLDDHPVPRGHYWSSHGWKIGNRSLDRARISSFAVLDEVLATVCSAEASVFPNLHTVVIVGHSAGGQFVNRYAAGGAGCTDPEIEVRYVIMNPSSYLYVDARRRAKASGSFGAVHIACAGYDQYKYGLHGLNAYMRHVGVDRIRQRLFTRHTWYLAGERDTATGGSLDGRCEAGLQGPNRLARFANYRDYARLFDDWKGAEFVTVPGVGHDGGRMLKSDIARRILFN
jgi:hypothetical protein